MAQQSTTEPREAPRQQGNKTRERQQRVIDKQEKTKGSEGPFPGGTLDDSAERDPKGVPGDIYGISSGDRSVPRGANDRGPHRKNRGLD